MGSLQFSSGIRLRLVQACLGSARQGRCCGAVWQAAADWQSAEPRGCPPRLRGTAAVANRRAGCQPAPHGGSDSMLIVSIENVRQLRHDNTGMRNTCGASLLLLAGVTAAAAQTTSGWQLVW